MDLLLGYAVAGAVLGFLIHHTWSLVYFEVLRRSPPARRREVLRQIEAAFFAGDE